MLELPRLILDSVAINSGAAALAVYGIVFAFALGHASYTDWFQGKLISNVTSLVLFSTSWAVAPLIWTNSALMLASALGWVLFATVLFFAGGMGGGDWKIYLALAPIFGPANLVFFVLASLLILVSVLFDWRGVRESASKKRGKRLGEVAALPAMTVAALITVGLIGCPWPFVAGLAGLTLLGAALTPVSQRFSRQARIQEALDQAGAEPHPPAWVGLTDREG